MKKLGIKKICINYLFFVSIINVKTIINKFIVLNARANNAKNSTHRCVAENWLKMFIFFEYIIFLKSQNELKEKR